MSVADFYSRILRDPELPASTQRRMLGYALAVKDQGILGDLAEHPALDPEVDARLGTVEIARVRARWIARPGRRPEEVVDLIGRERRIGVLSAIAALEGLPPDAYRAVQERASSWKTWLVLCENESVPDRVRKAAAARLGEHFEPGRSFRDLQQVRAALESRPELADAVASRLRRPELAAVLAKSEDLSPASVRRIVDVAVLGRLKPFLAAEARSPGRSASFIRRPAYDAFDVVLALGENVAMGVEVRDELREFLVANAEALCGTVDQLKSKLDAVVGLLGTAGQATTFAQLLMSARTTSDPEVIAQLVDHCVTTRDARMAATLASNPAVGADAVDRVADLIDYGARGTVAKRRQRDPEVLAVLLAQSTYLISDEMLMASGAPEEVLLLVARRLTGANRSATQLAYSRFMTERIAGALPVQYISTVSAQTGSHGFDVAPQLSRAIRERVERRLGDDDARWASFEGLYGTFSGTLDELLDAVTAITA